MKATIERATLLWCLSHVQSVVERRNTIPILSNVLIDADAGGSVRVMATDLDLQVVETMSASSVDQPGDCTAHRRVASASPDPEPHCQDGRSIDLDRQPRACPGGDLETFRPGAFRTRRAL